MSYPSQLGQYRDGKYRRANIIEVSTASTAMFYPEEKDSGAIYIFGVVSTISVGLPKISSKWLGLEYTFFFSTADAAGDYTVSTPYDSSAGIYVSPTTAGIGTPSTITPGSTDGPHAIRVTAISSVVWLGEALFLGDSTNSSGGSSVSGLPVGAWTTG